MEEKIKEMIPKMSKGQKKISNYILTNYDKAAFMTAAELGREVGVSESTVVRYAMLLGYKGYPEFQKDVSKLVQKRLSSIEKIIINDINMSREDVLNKVVESDIRKLQQSLEMIDINIFEEAVDSILNADNIYIVGIRNCLPLAQMLSFNLNIMLDKVKLITSNNVNEVFEQLIRISEKDVIIGISFPRYSMITLKAMEFANNRNAKVVTITDGINSPMNLYSSCNLFAKSELTSLMDSITAPMSIINAIIVAISIKKKDEVLETMDMIEKVMDDYQIDGGDEINIFNDSIDISTY